jgi:hypothetical protein
MATRCDYCGKFKKDELVEIIEVVCFDGFSLDAYAICNECDEKRNGRESKLEYTPKN